MRVALLPPTAAYHRCAAVVPAQGTTRRTRRCTRRATHLVIDGGGRVELCEVHVRAAGPARHEEPEAMPPAGVR